eukprot:5731504-Alexandrium_andersonii.AAC.1
MSTSSTSQPANRSMAERPSFLRPGPEKRCRHLGGALHLLRRSCGLWGALKLHCRSRRFRSGGQ